MYILCGAEYAPRRQEVSQSVPWHDHADRWVSSARPLWVESSGDRDRWSAWIRTIRGCGRGVSVWEEINEVEYTPLRQEELDMKLLRNWWEEGF
jgi:hypothetical protein